MTIKWWAKLKAEGRFQTILFVIFLIGLSTTARANEEERTEKEIFSETEGSGNSKQKVRPKILDFEAEVIEGERKTPNLFLQMELATPNLDAVIYKRKSFNDFHANELDRKPSYKSPAVVRGK